MTREDSAKWASLLQAQADGKKLEFEATANSWQVNELFGWHIDQHVADRWRIAPDLPPKPSQEWLDKHGVELTGEYRNPDESLYAPQLYGGLPDNDDVPKTGYCIGEHWILRRRAPQVKPWTIDTVPMPLVIRNKRTGILHVGVLADENGVAMHAYNEPFRVYTVRYDDLLNNDEQRDGSPCGEVVK